LFKRLCSTNREKKLFDLWQKLDDLTKKALEEIAKKLVSTETEQEPVSLEDMGLDAPNVTRRRGCVSASGFRMSLRRNGLSCLIREV
jgi:hypothetical protein